MRTFARTTLALGLGFVLGACGGVDDGDDGDGNGGAVDGGNGGEADSGTSGDWRELVTGTWSLPAGTPDTYWCARVTVPETMYIRSLRALAPNGTHHTVVTVADTNLPEEEWQCSPTTNEDTMLFASGVGTDRYDFPEGVAIKVEAGQQITINIHLYNASDDDYVDHVTGAEVLTIPESEVEHVAEMLFAGQIIFDIPDDGEDHMASGSCTFDSEATLLSIWPHMHKLGKHMLVEKGGVELHNAAFDFYEQKNYPIEPVVVGAGETINVTCTWNNPQGNGTVSFGDGSDDEMCFAGFYRYPATGDEGLFCDLPI